jgi:GMP synthase (glutamine-hydrolysing)
MKILIIDNTIDQDSWGSSELRQLAQLAPDATVHTRRAPHGDLPSSPRGYDRIILSGSKTSAMDDAPWIESLHRFVGQALDESIPYLGVCFGHQTLARVVGGKRGETNQICGKSKAAEIGWTKIEVFAESELFKNLPKEFYSFSSHYEEVNQLPTSLRTFARSADCAVQAVQLDDKPVYGIQFHPEKDIPSAEKTFTAKKKSPQTKNDRLLHAGQSKKYFNPAVGEAIFKNFLGLTHV